MSLVTNIACLLLAAAPLPPNPGAGESPVPEEEKLRKLPPGIVEIHVENLHCKSCARKLARKIYATPGVMRVRTYVDKNLAVIELQPKKKVEMVVLWRATEAAAQKPLSLQVLDQKFVAKDFPTEKEKTAKKLGESPHRR